MVVTTEAAAPQAAAAGAPAGEPRLEAVGPGAVLAAALRRSEWRGADPRVGRALELADGLVRLGVRYRRLKAGRRLGRPDLGAPRDRLSCSEFVWLLFSLAGLDMGSHPISSRRLAADGRPHAGALARVTDGGIHPGDVLVYGYPAGRPRIPGEVGHVVVVVSVAERLVVGSHGRESTPRGARRGVAYRRLLDGWERWPGGRTLRAVYRVVGDGD